MTAASRWVALLLVSAISLAGCWVARVEGPPADSLSTWSAEPLPPDQGLAATAASRESSCTAGPDGGPVRMLLQDRRTQWTAAFLFAGASSLGSCFVSSARGGSGGGSGPLPGPMTSPLSIDVNGFGDVGGGKASHLGGRIADEITRVVLERGNGQMVTASVADGYWLAWWPDEVAASTVSGFDDAGAEVVIVEAPR